MTTRERNIIIIVVAAIVIIVGYNIFFGLFAPPVNLDGKERIDLDKANRLLSSARNVTDKSRLITGRLNKLKAMFYPKAKLDEAEIGLLKEAESIAATCNLVVEQKNMIRYSDGLIGVTLNGKTTPESLFRFMHQTTESRFGIKISRLQVHVMEEQKLVEYQIAVSSLLL